MNKLYDLSDFENGFIYRTEEGDTIFFLSEKFHTTPAAIIFFNSLSAEPIPGELIYVEKIEGEKYTVKPGDTIEAISEKFRVGQDVILLKNKTDVLYVGQTIYV